MSIQYTYEIVKVDEAARCMEVVYASEGRLTMHIGARLPFEGESLEAVIQMYAPIAYWREQERAVVAPPVGLIGTLQEYAETLAAEDQFNSVFPTPTSGSIQSTTLE
jgi:hypothetical protein